MKFISLFKESSSAIQPKEKDVEKDGTSSAEDKLFKSTGDKFSKITPGI